jgi:hypothetical protein
MVQSTTTTAPPSPTQVLGTRYSSLCSLLGRPLIMTGLFRDILIRHFAASAYIEEPDLRHLIWKTGEDTNILIESVYRWRPELTEHRPAVLVKRNAYQNQRRGIGDRRQGAPADRYGHDKFTTLWVGSHTLFCVGGSGAQAELLGSEVQRELTQFGPAIAAVTGLLRLQVTQIGAVAELEEAQENWVVPVTVGYGYEESWEIRPQALRLSRVSLSLLTDC